MILRKNNELFELIKGLSGVNQFTPSEQAHLVSFTNRRLVAAYNQSQVWSRYVVVGEERKISSFTVSGITDVDAYNATYYKYGELTQSAADGSGDFTSDFFVPINQIDSTNNQTIIAFYKNNSKRWVWGTLTGAPPYEKSTEGVVDIGTANTTFATQQENKDVASPVNVIDWGNVQILSGYLVVQASNVIPYASTHEVLNSSTTRVPQTQINEFIRIHRNQSFLNDSTTEYDFYVDSNGANILNSSAINGEVFVTYKKNIIDISTGKVIDTLDVDNSLGIAQIPNEFFSYTAHSVYADFLRLDGQTDKAFAEESQADNILALELEQIDIINNRNSLNHKFSTYVNTSSR
tara:strand:+ start:2248 stop:3294 length:1047 start_codon:yes stop_codon:yes gene_type:complete